MKEETEDKLIRAAIILVCLSITAAASVHAYMMVKYSERYPNWCIYRDDTNNITITGIDCEIADQVYKQKKSIYDDKPYNYDYLINSSFDLG